MRLWPLGGRDPEPLQRPRLAGVIAAGLASVPAALLVWWTGAAHMPAQVIGVSEPALVALSIIGLTVSGALYGAIFLRAANDWRGGWLFGLGWGFLTWALGPITICQWLLGRPISVGIDAAILLVAHHLWGLAFGLVFPLIQDCIELKIEEARPPREKSLHRRNPLDHAPQSYRRTSGERR